MPTDLHLNWRIRLLDQLLRLQPPVHHRSLEELRQLDETPISPIVLRLFGGKRVVLPEVMPQTVAGRHGAIPIQLYYPSTQAGLPLMLFFHGGGWIYGNFQTHDFLCRRLAYHTGAIVLAVRYRLAPFFRYPVALEECEDVLRWVVQQATSIRADPNKIIVVGDSAGGNLAAALCLLARDQQLAVIAQQILIYPVTSGVLDQPSVDRYADAPVLTKDMMQSFVSYYARDDSDVRQPYFSPLLAEDLSHLPPALILTCEYDLLRDQALGYAQRLQAAGNQVLLVDYPGMVHGFLSFPPFCRQAQPAFEQIAAAVNSVAN